MVELVIRIEGIGTHRDAAALGERLARLRGVVVLDVGAGTRYGEVTVDYDPDVVSPETIARTIADEGYRPTLNAYGY